MASFKKVTMAFAKMFRIVKSRFDLILILTLLLVLMGVYLWIEIDDPAKIWEKNPVTIKCNDPNIDHPMAEPWTIVLKYFLMAFGILLSCVFEDELMSTDYLGIQLPKNGSSQKKVIRRRTYFILFFLIGLFGLLIITKSGLVQVIISNNYLMARDFLAVCRPHRLDLLCGNRDSQHSVQVICTTSVQTWMPAAKSMIPKTLIIYYYLMLTTMFRMTFKWDWKENLRGGLNVQAIIIAFIVGVGVVSVFLCNEGHPLGVLFGCILILGMALSLVVIDVLLALIYDDYFPDEEEELPRYWNDVPQKKTIPSVSQQTPTTPLTPCGNQKTSAMMGPALKPQKDSSTDNPPPMSIYPKLTPELYEWKDIVLGDPPDSINRY
jgi:hypothetical protein